MRPVEQEGREAEGGLRPCALALGTAALLASASIGVAASDGREGSFHGRVAWQIALERVGFSPGIIDGIVGPKTRLATRQFQRVRALPQTGRLDDRTAAALGVDPANALATYVVEAEDLKQVGPVPRGWVEKSQLKRLAYPSLDEWLAEKFHCSRRLLARLNPGRDLARLGPGDRIRVPAIDPSPPAPRGARVEIDLSAKVIRVIDGERRLVGLFHCSVARERADLPSGQGTVAVIAHDPTYTFDPKKWPEVRGVDRKLIIPPGPRNPVGLVWIGLSLRGYGIHGSPAPELIGRTGSHGCIRLTNWDALRLARMVRVGTPVAFATAAGR